MPIDVKDSDIIKDCGFGDDKNIPDRKWNCYLKKYSSLYRLKRDECGVWYIITRNGQIKPHSIVNSNLAGYFIVGERKKNNLLRKLPSYCKVFQEGDGCLSVWFPENKLMELVDPLEVIKKKQLSPEHIELLRTRMNKINGINRQRVSQ